MHGVDDEIVSILDVGSGSMSGISSSASNHEISKSAASECKSDTSDCGNVTGAKEVSDCLLVTDSDPKHSTVIPVQNIECKAVSMF